MLKYMPLYLGWRHFTCDTSRTPACDPLLQGYHGQMRVQVGWQSLRQ